MKVGRRGKRGSWARMTASRREADYEERKRARELRHHEAETREISTTNRVRRQGSPAREDDHPKERREDDHSRMRRRERSRDDNNPRRRRREDDPLRRRRRDRPRERRREDRHYREEVRDPEEVRGEDRCPRT